MSPPCIEAPVRESTRAKTCSSLEDVLNTDELDTRPCRPANYRAESEALVALAKHLADSPKSILQKLVDTALDLCQAQSAGISIEESSSGEDIFRWQATAGEMTPFLGGTMPRNFSPCGVTVDRQATQMMRDPVRFYPYIAGLNIPVRELLLVPFFAKEKAVGTVWIVSHSEAPVFDAEDARLINSLAQFASAACESLMALEKAEKTQQQLEQVGAKLEAALNAGAIATWSWDIVNNRVFADANFTKLFAVSEEDAQGGPIAAYIHAIHPEDRERVQQLIAKTVDSGAVYECEYRVRQTDGSYRWVIARGKSLFDEAGKAIHFPGVAVDITERKVAQLDQEKQHRALWAALPVACYTLDAEGRLTFFNDAAVKLWGRIPEIGTDKWGGAKALFSLDGSLMPGDLSSAAVAVKERRSVRGAELFVERADGTRRWVISHPDPIFDSSGTFIGVVNVLFDVTEERLARASLVEARDQAVAASRAKDDFLAALSHELRTPLNPALLRASDAASNEAYSPEAREEFEGVRKNIELEARLIDDLLDITKITRGVMTLECTVVDLHQVLQEAVQKVQTDADTKGIVLHWQLKAEHAVVNGDAARLQQVFWNILKNAVKFTPAGGAIHIASAATAKANEAAIRIQDSGIGMEPWETETIFNAFVQGKHAQKGSAHLFGGLGLGLAISQKVMELHGGSIAAASEGPRKGSSFTVTMPMATVESSQRAPVSSQSAPPSLPPAGLRILIVEDNDSTREALQRLLSRRGHEVMTADCGQAARQLVADQPFDLAICDVGLPDTDGHALLTELHKLRPGLPSIAMTGYGTDKDVARSGQAGFLLHLTKPVSVSRLQEAIAHLGSQGAWNS